MAISPLKTLQAIVPQIPTLKDVTYHSRTSGDTFDAGTTFDARRGPMTIADVDGLQRKFATWYLYALDGQSTLPSRFGKIVDGSDTWHILQVEHSYDDLRFICQSVLAV